MNKLSRLSTPSSINACASRSRFAPAHASSSASSSSTASSHSYSHSAYMTRQYDGAFSGSETERESQRAPTPSYSNSHSNSRSYGSSYPERSSTPASVSAQHTRECRTSASSSPTRQREPSPGRSHGPRQRVFMVSTASAPVDHASHDVMSAALAAVASAFRDDEERHTFGRQDWQTSIGPTRSHHNPHRDSHTSNANPQYSPRGAHVNRSSTVLDLTCRHQTRWLSDDMSSHPDSGRRQTQRGGSAESLLRAGVHLVGEDLRTAGIGMRNGNRTTDDHFGQANDPQVPLRRAWTTVSSTNRTVE
ncbi:hypothetical protein AZE42_09189 [Rhizopogon vesiculosus]|uniref:Uncharacterized protein n=1 Tax=Rhizopogon vesiculosus TaxID=180088 RepID=A0A1J8QB46_9AGAM|nr:hypothetical protein AZE42_09189 [Rhizopogon vesiculosus]